MRQIKRWNLLLLGILNFLCLHAQSSFQVLDSISRQPVEFASWQLEGTTLGGFTDFEGRFEIVRAQAGDYQLQIRFIGYRDYDLAIRIKERNEQQTILLVPTGIQLEQVTVSAQLDGQRAAIQRQVSADAIMNVVSKDRIEEIPDQNAAETVGRIPGVSLQRDGGEATKVSIRGLSPRYNAITINGERIPATDGEDRSVDLSMISTDALAGIEVYKSITPDQDGDAVGGTVNFLIKRARQGFRGNLKASLGYNDLMNETGLPRASFSLSNRFLNNRLGLIATGNYQLANRSSDLLTGSYVSIGEDSEGNAIINAENINLADRLENRERYGGSLSLDYDLPSGTLVFSSFLGVVERDELRYRTRFRPETSRKEYELLERFNRQLTWNNTLSGELKLEMLQSVLTFGGGYARTDSDTPLENTARFRENGAFNDQIDESSLESVFANANNNFSRTFFQQARLDETAIDTRKYTANLNWQVPFQTGNWLEGFIKIGGKYRQQTRSRETSRQWSAFDAIDQIALDNPDRFELNDDGRITINQFFGDHDPGIFLDNRFGIGLGPTLDEEQLRAFNEAFAADYYSEDQRLRLQNYNSSEDIAAAYLMTKLVLWKKLTVIPGVRYEHTATAFDGLFGRSFELEGQVFISATDTTGSQRYGEFLPMIQAKYQLKPWMDLRLATTRTLARPNFFDLVPYQQIDDINQIVQRGNSDLVHTTAWNFDAFLSMYNEWGLLSLGAFSKRLDNVDYQRISRDLEPGSATRGYQLITRDNLPTEVRVWGAEIDLQANFTFLPEPFNGLLINANYTFIESETLFPLLEVREGEPPFFIPTVVDTFRSGVLPDQPNSVLNLSIGYERGGFSGRISVVRQGETLQFVGDRAEVDGRFRAFSRWDLALKQELGESNWSVFLNLNNLTNTPEFTFLTANQRFPLEEEYFGWTAELGGRYKF
ncbi:MAG: TonB-dependent receptor [Bacteroidota bacterium]